MDAIDRVLANKARATGADGWLAAIPSLVADLERRWSITIGEALPGGTEAWVAAASDERGRPAVLKLCLPRRGDDPNAEARREATVLELTGGSGCARLYRSDLDRGALLIERLGPSMADLRLPYERRSELLVGLAAALWRPGDGVDLPTGADHAARLDAFTRSSWFELDRPCSERALTSALEAAERRRRAHDPARAVVVHGDVHQWNALRTLDGDDWRLIDPDGLVAEPELDLGVLIREDPEASLADIEAGDPGRRARRLARRTGTDAGAIEDWGLIERVATGLLATRIGLQPVGRQMLAVADRLAGG